MAELNGIETFLINLGYFGGFVVFINVVFSIYEDL